LELHRARELASVWLNVGRARMHSDATLALRRGITERFFWWCESNRYQAIDADVIRAFLIYLAEGPADGSPRWPNFPKAQQKVTSGTVATYHRHLRAMFRWMESEDHVPVSPMARVQAPIDRPDQIDPFTTLDIQRLMDAARKSTYPERDLAILHFLLDTGVRASELCAMVASDIDFDNCKARIFGKGGKVRTVFFHSRTKEKLFAYIRIELRRADEPLWAGEQGALQRNGLQQLLERIGKRAGVTKVNPHRFRHTFALWFLRADGDRGTLQELLGHTDIRMVQRYVNLAQVDIERGHRKCSPVGAFYEQKRRAR
jgi:integrase